MKTPSKIEYPMPLEKVQMKNNDPIIERFFTFNRKEDVRYPFTAKLTKKKKQKIRYCIVVISRDGRYYFGISRCSHLDTYNEEHGRNLARSRAFSLLSSIYFGNKKISYEKYTGENASGFLPKAVGFGLTQMDHELKTKIEGLHCE